MKKKYVKNRNYIDKFSLFPTLLSFINFEVQDGHAGFGFSGFGKLKNDSKKNIFSEENDHLIRKYNRFQYSKNYYELW